MRISDWSSDVGSSDLSETALFYLSDIYLTGKGVPRNVPLGMTYLQRAAQAGHASSAYHMGLIYRQGLYGHAADPQQSLYWIEKAARAGRLQAMVEMARTYDRGIGVDKDARQAFRSEEHTSELQSLMRISYAVFCLKKHKRH